MNYKLGLGTTFDKNLSERIENLRQTYLDIFGKDQNADKQSLFVTYAPGRAEIIGNHTDYNEGYTISANISQNLLMIGKPNGSNKVRVISLNEARRVSSFLITSPTDMLGQKSQLGVNDEWANYIKGVIWAFMKHNNRELKGFNAVIESTIPLGGGVSSSAAIELATAHFICVINNLTVSLEKLISICKDAENNYVGAPCGFLDQATVALADSTMLFISYKRIKNLPFTWDIIDINLKKHGLTFIIGYDLSSKHSLVEGKYAVRQNACKKSIPVLERLLKKNIKSLRDIKLDEFKELDPDMFANTAIPYKWISHVISENQRVMDAKRAIEQKDMEAFGKLLTASGKSAIYDYQLAEDAPELTWLYETVLKNKKAWGIIGTRNMGGGFNATTLSLVKSEKADFFKTSLQKLYNKKFRSNYQFLEFTLAPSARYLDILGD